MQAAKTKKPQKNQKKTEKKPKKGNGAISFSSALLQLQMYNLFRENAAWTLKVPGKLLRKI